MTQHFPLDYGDVVHEGFFDPIQELLGASLSLRIAVSNASTLIIQAGVGNEQVSATLTNSTGTVAGFRWITSAITATVPGGLTNGTGSVYITAADNDFSGGFADPDAGTDYSFSMEIRASGTPSTDLWRKVGEVDVSGGSIVAFRAMGGPRPTGEFGLTATPDTASQPGLLVTGRASQTGNLIETKNSSGTTVYSVSPAGATSQSGGITTSSTNGITASGNGGKATLNLSNTGSNTGITIGGDVELYRAGANALQTDDSVTIRRTSSGDTTLATRVTTDANDRTSITAGGDLQFGSGSATPDVRVRRSGTTTITVDTPSAGAAALSVSGALTVGTNLNLSQATTAGHVLIADGTGLMNLGQIADLSIASNAVTTAKINNGAVTAEKIASGVLPALAQTISAKTDDYTPAAADVGNLVTMNASTAKTFTIATSLGLSAGQRIDFARLGTGGVTFVAGSGVTLNGTPGLVLREQYSAATVVCISSNNYLVVGDLTAA